MHNVHATVPVLLALLISTGCAHLWTDQNERMLQLGSALTKVSKAAEAEVRYRNPPEGLSEAELLARATAHDPALLDPFRQYAVRVLRQDRHAVVLVCTPDRARALLEDAGCTAALDRQAWTETPPPSCEFTLNVEKVCQAP